MNKEEQIRRVKNIITMSVNNTSEEHTKSLENLAEYVFEIAYQAGQEAKETEIKLAFEDRFGTAQVPANINNLNGEWCGACGAWKQYGVADTHGCTGYKVIC